MCVEPWSELAMNPNLSFFSSAFQTKFGLSLSYVALPDGSGAPLYS